MNRVPEINYPFVATQVKKDDGSVEWEAEVPDLPGCAAGGDTFEELLELLEMSIEAWVETAKIRGMDIPEPSTADRFSGKITLRMPPNLHRLLALQAKRGDVSLNSYINLLLAYNYGRESSLHLTMLSITASGSSPVTDSATFLPRPNVLRAMGREVSYK